MTSQSLSRIAALGQSIDGESLDLLSATDTVYMAILISEAQNQTASYEVDGPPIDISILTQPQLQAHHIEAGDQKGWQSPTRKHTA